MQLWIQQIEQADSAARPLFCVSNGLTLTTPTELPNPAAYPVIGYEKKRLLPELAWYLEQYLEMPAGADAQRADAITATLKAWDREAFDRLFDNRVAGLWYENARGSLSDLEIKIVSASPAVLSWPWEALHSGDEYLSLHCCMERQPPNLNLPYKAPKKTDALHILFIVSRPDTKNKVNYHGLEREIIRYIRDNNAAVTVDVLRPPTFDNLRKTLETRRGYYHIVHFDGHGGYGSVASDPAKYQGMEGQLVFETDAAEADLVGAEKLGQLLTSCGVSMMVLNACQSAMIDDKATDPFASVAARLLKAGIPSVVAMGYSLYVSAAKQFVPAFYDALFRNGGPAGAMRAGRQTMYAHPERPCFYGECPLQDWIVPELYQQISAGKRILPAVQKLSGAWEDAFPDDLRQIGDYGLIGRGREIHDLERILQRNRQAGILIHGMAGAGKTTLAKGFLHWLRDTSGLREADGADCPVFWFNFQEIHSADAILNPLADAFLGETARTMDTQQKLDLLSDCLKRNRAFLIWDNFESASGIPGTEVAAFMSEKERKTLKTLLHNLRGGKTRVFITSRRNEDWLSLQECARLETLGGLEGDERWDYCREVVRDLGLTIDRDDKDLKALLDKLGGNPLALRVILLRLGEGKKAKELLVELDRQFKGAAGDDGTEQIQKAFGVLKSGIAPELSPVLQVIGLHEHFADAGFVASILANIEQARPDTPERQSLRERVTRCFQILENAGLCIHEGNNVYRLHPALRGCLAVTYPPPEDVKRWFVRYLAYVEDRVHNDAAQRAGLFSYYEANFLHAKTLAETLDMREEELLLIFGLARYANDRSRTALAEERYREMAEKAHRYGDFDKENRAYRDLAALAKDPERERFWMGKATDMWNGAEDLDEDEDALFTLGQNAESHGDNAAAMAYYKRAISILERKESPRVVPLYALLASLAQDEETAIEWYQKQWKKAKEKEVPFLQAHASCSLGRISAKRGDSMEALERYREALDIFTVLQNPFCIAGTLNDMGRLFVDIGAYDEAKDALIQSVKIAECIGEKQVAAADYNELGRLSESQSDFISAKEWFAKALSMLDIWDERNVAVARRNLERVTAQINGGK